MLRSEQEVVIRFDNESDEATIYTSHPVWMRKLEKYAAENKEFKLKNEWLCDKQVISRTYVCPKDLINIKGKRRVMTEEQRRAAAERLRAARLSF